MAPLTDLQQAFVAWALDPRLNDEEAFGAELLVEGGLSINDGIVIPTIGNMAEEAAIRKRRQVNPAHRTRLNRAEVEVAASKIPLVATSRMSGYTDDRPLRDITGLRFFPHYTNVHLSNTELTDITVLTTLPLLDSISLMDRELEDLRPLGKCQALRNLSLYLYRAWPKFAGLENLPLETVRLHVNLLALASIPALPQVRNAYFTTDLTLPDATHLPAMPQLKTLELDGRCIERLDGIERFPLLCNLTVSGPIRDLRPLLALRHLTHLTIKACIHRPGILRDLAPLCELPELRRLKLVTSAPMDLFVLMDAPKLCEVVTENSDRNARDAETLAASLRPWSKDFLGPALRPLPPLRFAALDCKILTQNYAYPLFTDGPDGWHGNLGMRESENRWFHHWIRAQLNQFFGSRTWGEVRSHTTAHYRSIDVDLCGFAAAGRIEEVVELLRRSLARCLYRSVVSLRVYSDTYEPEPERPERGEEEILEDHREHEARRAEATRLLEKRQRYEQLRAEGVKIDPAEFAEEIEVERSENDALSIFAGFISGSLAGWGIVREDGFFIAQHMRQPIEQLMEREAETL